MLVWWCSKECHQLYASITTLMIKESAQGPVPYSWRPYRVWPHNKASLSLVYNKSSPQSSLSNIIEMIMTSKMTMAAKDIYYLLFVNHVIQVMIESVGGIQPETAKEYDETKVCADFIANHY